MENVQDTTAKTSAASRLGIEAGLALAAERARLFALANRAAAIALLDEPRRTYACARLAVALTHPTAS